jgi:hypothetical protein
MDYRVYIVSENGHFVGVHEIEAPDDDAAIHEAKQYVDGLAVEVWHRDRYVARIDGSKHKR